MYREKTVLSLKEAFKMQMLQFDYPRHAKDWVVFIHLAYILACLVLNVWISHVGLCSLAGLASWNYFLLFDMKRCVYRDAYRPKPWEYVGTLVATVIFAVLIYHFSICPIDEMHIRLH